MVAGTRIIQQEPADHAAALAATALPSAAAADQARVLPRGACSRARAERGSAPAQAVVDRPAYPNLTVLIRTKLVESSRAARMRDAAMASKRGQSLADKRAQGHRRVAGSQVSDLNTDQSARMAVVDPIYDLRLPAGLFAP